MPFRRPLFAMLGWALLIQGALYAQSSPADMSVPARDYLGQALDLMEKNSFHRRELDWAAIRREAMRRAAGAQSPADTYQAIRLALQSLGDRHSFLQLVPELQAKDNEARARRNDRSSSSLRAETWPPSPYVDRKEIQGSLETVQGVRAAIIVVPQLDAGEDGAMHAFANTLQQKLAELGAQHPDAWIVDLRGNLGGDMWPMLAGIGPLAGETTLGSFVDADQKRTTWFYATDGAGVLSPDGKRGIQLWMPGQQVRFTRPPRVAVLLDRGTASSGEAIALSFRGRPDCRSFGRHTHGQTTANDSFPLPDGANMLITTGLEADRTGTVYPDGITPDVELPEETRKAPDVATDPAIAAAAAWIKGKSQDQAARARRVSLSQEHGKAQPSRLRSETAFSTGTSTH